MELLRFIFSDFWIWLGFEILLSVIVQGAVYIFRAIFRIQDVEVPDEQVERILKKLLEDYKESK